MQPLEEMTLAGHCLVCSSVLSDRMTGLCARTADRSRCYTAHCAHPELGRYEQPSPPCPPRSGYRRATGAECRA
jgi:hypothetical protein